MLLSQKILSAQISKAEIIATGLTCSMCSNAINKQLTSLPEVAKVETDLNTNTFMVYIKKDSKITPKILKENIEKTGFFVGSMVLTMQFEDLKTEDNLSITINNLSLVFIDKEAKILNGETKVKILNKGFITQKEFKKLIKSYNKYQGYGTENNDNYYVKTI